MRSRDLVWAVLSLAACSSTTYTHLAPVDPPPPFGPDPATSSALPLSSDKGRVVVHLSQGQASAVEENDAGLRLACSATPCVDDVAPGTHRYWLVPHEGMVHVDQDGVVLSKDGVYPAPVETRVNVERGRTLVLRASLGRTEVRRAFPPARAIGWTLFATGVAIAILGVVSAASAPSGSPDGETATGLAELGVGVLTLGGALFLSNTNDSVTVTDHPGVAVKWGMPRATAGCSSRP